MTRKLNKLADDKQLFECLAKAGEQSYTEVSFTIDVITPLFGGSARTGEPDAMYPVRASSVRGHLRFWWRATRGAMYPNAYELRRKEIEIFGDTANPSPVTLWIEATRRPVITRESETWKKGLPSYVVFPFDSGKSNNSKNKAPAAASTDKPSINKYVNRYPFTLHVRVPSDQKPLLEKELYPALWAWINFGGIGARTRRGCGSLYCKAFSPRPDDDLAEWFADRLQKYKLELPVDDHHREWPVLRGRLLIAQAVDKPLEAWRKAVEVYRDFRRRATSSRGRSYWPEADSIREMTGMEEGKHHHSNTLKDRRQYAFPRAEFGLPIQFQFANGPSSKAKDRDPYPTILNLKNKDRLASPVITKALAVSSDKYYPIIAVLSHPMIEELELKWVGQGREVKDKFNSQEGTKQLTAIKITGRHVYVRSNYEHNHNNPMRIPGVDKPSAVEAFLNSREVQRWKKIVSGLSSTSR